MVVLPHCRPGSHSHHGHAPVRPWPDTCQVQWGDHGLVLPRVGNDSYFTAFFEAFPTDPSTFIRGEGDTIASAEENAWKKWLRIRECPGHEFEKRGYENGAGFCRFCNLFQSKVFPPENPCRFCGTLTYYGRDNKGSWVCEVCVGLGLVPEDDKTEAMKYLERWKTAVKEEKSDIGKGGPSLSDEKFDTALREVMTALSKKIEK